MENAIEQLPKTKFSIVGKKETDSEGTKNWQRYTNSHELQEAWSPPKKSFFARFQKLKTIRAIDKIKSDIQPRYSEGESTSEAGIGNLIRKGLLTKDTAVVLDSGGAHSVAMAVKLAEETGHQPIVMFDSEPHPEGNNKSEQELATMLYFADRMKRLKQSGRIQPDAPPVFVLDCHRDDYFSGKGVNNTYTYSERDFPSADELRKRGITRVVYLNEGDQNGEIRPDYQSTDRLGQDLKKTVGNWIKSGIEVVYTGVQPWKHDREHDRFERLAHWDEF